MLLTGRTLIVEVTEVIVSTYRVIVADDTDIDDVLAMEDIIANAENGVDIETLEESVTEREINVVKEEVAS